MIRRLEFESQSVLARRAGKRRREETSDVSEQVRSYSKVKQVAGRSTPSTGKLRAPPQGQSALRPLSAFSDDLLTSSSRISPHQSKLSVLYRLGDGALVVGCLWLVTWLYGANWSSDYAVAAASGVGAFYFCAEVTHVYGGGRGALLRQIAARMASAWLGAVFALLLLGWATKSSADFSRVAIGLWFATVPGVWVLWRWGVRRVLGVFRTRGYNIRRVAVVGTGEQSERLARTISGTPALGFELVGFFDDRSPSGGRVVRSHSAPVVGNLETLVALARAGEVDLVYITLTLRAEERIQRLLDSLSDTTAHVYLVPNFLIFNLVHACWVNLGDIPTVSITETPFFGVGGWLKRFEDLLLSSLVLALMALPMSVIALGVKLSSPGPVLFKQRRYGLDGREFRIYKFRTMTVCEDGPDIAQARRDDPRITRFGALLRRFSLDELPQFINVLQGRMSIVGPRPHASAHNELYRRRIKGYMLRHLVKPGITGWAQVNGCRGETPHLEQMEARVRYDLDYMRNWSLALDLRIILKTTCVIAHDRKAY